VKKQGVKRFAFLMVVPIFLGYCFFGLVPYVRGFYYSVFKWSGFSPVMTFIGFDNFARMLTDNTIGRALYNNVMLGIITVAGTFVLSLFFAVAITRFRFKEAIVYRITYFFPYVMPSVAIATLWRFIFNPTMGILNGLLSLLGLESLHHAWLGDTSTVLGALAAPSIWGGVGFYMVLFIAGIQNSPVTLYEAAEIDGASQTQQFIRITFPLLWEIVRTMLVLYISGVFSVFASVMVMAGNTNTAAEVIGTYMYKHGFRYADFGYGTAIGVLIFVISLALALLARKLTDREVIEY
jgi:N-acetylglucosamine transport system permease protein